MSDLDHSLLMAFRDFIRPVVYEVVREVVREELEAQRRTAPIGQQPSLYQAEYLSVKHASERFDISQNTLRNWINAGRIKAYRMGGCVRLKVSDLERGKVRG